MAKNVTIKIKDIERKYRIITDNLVDALWVVDAETLRFEYITPSIHKISGYNADEYMKFTVLDRFTTDSYIKALKALEEEKVRFDQGIKSIRTLELELKHRDGNVYWVEIKARFLKEKGKPLKIVGVTRDINEKKKYENQQKELIKQLTDALGEKEKLLKEVKMLESLLPICSGCKRIRDEHNKWWPLDAYIRKQKLKIKTIHIADILASGY